MLWLLSGLLLLSSVAVAWAINKYVVNGGNYWKSRGIPSIKGHLPIVGNMWSLLTLRESFGTMYEKFYNENPDKSMVGFYNFTEPYLLIRDPELVKTVMHSEFKSFSENTSCLDKKLDPLLYRNPFFNYGEDWKTQRNALNNALSNKRLKIIINQVRNVATKFDNFIDENVKKNKGEFVIEAQDLFSHFTAEVVAAAAFGIDGKSFTNNPTSFHKIVNDMIGSTTAHFLNELISLCYPQLKKIVGVRFLPQTIDKYFREIIHDVVEARKKFPPTEKDFLQQLIESKETNDDNMKDDDYVVAHATSFFLDGQITSSFGMSFVALQLAQHPEVQDKIREEIDRVLEKHNGVMDYESLQELKYLEQVISESLRLTPPLGMLSKNCTEEYQLVGSDGLRVKVQPGTRVVISVHGLHHDPKYWKDPYEFDPERFSEENKVDQHKYVYLPFGAGPRLCTGMRVAMFQTKISLVTLLRGYSLKLHSSTRVPAKVNSLSTIFTVVDGGVWISIEPLTSRKT